MPRETKSYAMKTRERLAASQVLPRLMDHFEGKLELTPTQIQVGLKLLNKVVPDLKAIEHSGEVGAKHSVDKQTIEQAAKAVVERINAARI